MTRTRYTYLSLRPRRSSTAVAGSPPYEAGRPLVGLDPTRAAEERKAERIAAGGSSKHPEKGGAKAPSCVGRQSRGEHQRPPARDECSIHPGRSRSAGHRSPGDGRGASLMTRTNYGLACLLACYVWLAIAVVALWGVHS